MVKRIVQKAGSWGFAHAGAPRPAPAIAMAGRDLIALVITFAAILMFVGTGGATIGKVFLSLSGIGIGPDRLLVSALLLNIALIIFGWRRYRQIEQEVRERRLAEEQARILAETDPLTGCLNRRSIGAATDSLIAAQVQNGQAAVAMVIDLDNFKQVNDYNGHGIGDQILQQCAQRIGALLPANALLARLGGDEFACVVPFEVRRASDMEQLAETILAAVCQPITTNGAIIEVSASLGLARSDLHADQGTSPSDSSTLLHMADIAMYNAKKRGRNCAFWFESQMEDELRLRNELEAGIRNGIPRGEFVPYYEQQIDIQTGELAGFEILARWHSPTLGVVSPDIFIPIAEQIGAIGELSESLLRQALNDARDWNAELTLAVNISPVQLRDPWFAQKLLKLLVEANFPPQRLEIEITESCLHENVGVVRTLITSLKNQGIRISLDDFGTGYSSLSQLRNLPFDRIKIDRSFVTNIIDSKDSAIIVHAIAMLGKGLGLPITAEGIENEAVLDQLRNYGKLKGQGYLYGHPLAAAQTREHLARLNLLDRAASETVDVAAAEPAILPIRAAAR